MQVAINSSKANITSFGDKWENHKTSFMRNEFWSELRYTLSLLHVPPKIIFDYADSSLTVRTKCRRICVKITTNGELQIERKITNTEFKSEISRYHTVKESIEHFVAALQKHLQISRLPS